MTASCDAWLDACPDAESLAERAARAALAAEPRRGDRRAGPGRHRPDRRCRAAAAQPRPSAARIRRPTCCPSRWPTRTSSRRPARRSCSAMSCSPSRPSRARRRSSASRWPTISRHLVVHGVLHLLGFDHESDARGRDHGSARDRDTRAAGGAGRRIATPCERANTGPLFSMSDSEPPDGDGQSQQTQHEKRRIAGAAAQPAAAAAPARARADPRPRWTR